MNNRLQSHFFWGPHAPLSTLAGAGLIIMASSRLAYAIYCAGALLWIDGLTALVFYSSRKIMPQKGRFIILLFLSSLFCGFYLFFAGLLNPLLVSAAWFFTVLIPPRCMGSGFFEAFDDEVETKEVLPQVLLEAGCLGLLAVGVALIREPLGLGSLSFPGGIWGITEIFTSKEAGEGFFPMRLLSISAGGFLILGFGAALFRHFRGRQFNAEDES